MLYYSAEARESAIKRIDDLGYKIGSIPGNYLSYTDAIELGRFLSMLKGIIQTEESSREHLANIVNETQEAENELKNLKSLLENAISNIDEYFKA